MDDVSILVSRPSSLLGSVIGWLDPEGRPRLPATGLAALVRIEDFLDGDCYVLRAELPGLAPDDVSLELEDGVLIISGERPAPPERQQGTTEFHYGIFVRSVLLPRGLGLEEIEAVYADGVLEVRAPVRGPMLTTLCIPIDQRLDG